MAVDMGEGLKKICVAAVLRFCVWFVRKRNRSQTKRSGQSFVADVDMGCCLLWDDRSRSHGKGLRKILDWASGYRTFNQGQNPIWKKNILRLHKFFKLEDWKRCILAGRMMDRGQVIQHAQTPDLKTFKPRKTRIFSKWSMAKYPLQDNAFRPSNSSWPVRCSQELPPGTSDDGLREGHDFELLDLERSCRHRRAAYAGARECTHQPPTKSVRFFLPSISLVDSSIWLVKSPFWWLKSNFLDGW